MKKTPLIFVAVVVSLIFVGGVSLADVDSQNCDHQPETFIPGKSYSNYIDGAIDLIDIVDPGKTPGSTAGKIYVPKDGKARVQVTRYNGIAVEKTMCEATTYARTLVPNVRNYDQQGPISQPLVFGYKLFKRTYTVFIPIVLNTDCLIKEVKKLGPAEIEKYSKYQVTLDFSSLAHIEGRRVVSSWYAEASGPSIYPDQNGSIVLNVPDECAYIELSLGIEGDDGKFYRADHQCSSHCQIREGYEFNAIDSETLLIDLIKNDGCAEHGLTCREYYSRP